MLDAEECEQAPIGRDTRYDGHFLGHQNCVSIAARLSGLLPGLSCELISLRRCHQPECGSEKSPQCKLGAQCRSGESTSSQIPRADPANV